MSQSYVSNLESISNNVIWAQDSSLNFVVNSAEKLSDAVFMSWHDFENLLLTVFSSSDPQTHNDDLIQGMAENWEEIAQASAGIIAVIIVTILFVLFCIFGFLFFCCCGGKKGSPIPSKLDQSSAWKKSHMFVLTIFAILLMAASGFIFTSNNRSRDFLLILPDKIIEIWEAAKVILSSVEGLISSVKDTAYDLLETISNKLLNLSQAFVAPFIANILALLKSPLENLKQLETDSINLKSQLEGAQNKVTLLINHKNSVINRVDQVKLYLQNSCNDNSAQCQAIQTAALEIQYSGPNNLDTISNNLQTQLNEFNNILNSNDVTQIISNAETQINSVENEIQTLITSLTNDLKTEIDKINNTISSTFTGLDDLSKVLKDVSDDIQNSQFIGDIEDSLREPLNDYAPKVHLGVMIFTIFVVLAALMFVYPLISYVLGGGCRNGDGYGQNQQIQTSCGVEFFSKFSVYFGFLLGLIIMIVTFVLFIGAGLPKNFVCDPMSPIEFQLVQFLESTEFNNSKLPEITKVNPDDLSIEKILNQQAQNLDWDPPLPKITASDLLQTCAAEDGNIYDLLQLQNLNVLKLSDSFDIENQVTQIQNDIDSQLQTEINKALSSINGWSNDLENFSDTVKNGVNDIDFDDLNNLETSGADGSGKSIDEMIGSLNQINAPASSQAVSDLENIKSNEYSQMQTTYDELITRVYQNIWGVKKSKIADRYVI